MTEISGYAHLDENGNVPVPELGNMGGLKITYAGTPNQPTLFNLISGVAALPYAAGSGQATYGNNAPAIEAFSNSLSGITSISFDDLKSIGPGSNTLQIGGAVGLTNISFPSLTFIGCAAVFQTMQDLATLDLSALVSIYGSLTIGDSLPDLTSLDLHSLQFSSDKSSGVTLQTLTGLTSVNLSAYQNGGLAVSLCSALTSVSADAWVSGRALFSGNTLLATVSLSNLAHANGISFSGNPALTTLSFPELLDIVGDFYFSGNSETSLSATSLTSISGRLYIDGENSLTSLTLSSLATIGTDIHVNNNAAITSLTLDAVTTVGVDDESEIIGNTLLASISMANVASFAASLNVTENPALTSITLTNLVSTNGNTNFGGNDLLVTLNLPAATTLGDFSIGGAAFTTFSATNMQTYNGGIASLGSGTISSATLGTIGTLKVIAANVGLAGEALPSANVNAILALLVSLDGTGGTTLWGAGQTVDMSGGTSGAPTGQGIVDAVTLTGRGATVTTN